MEQHQLVRHGLLFETLTEPPRQTALALASLSDVIQILIREP